MATYRFEYLWHCSRPSDCVQAETDEEAYKEIEAYLKEKPGTILVSGTIRRQEYRAVADPPGIKTAPSTATDMAALLKK